MYMHGCSQAPSLLDAVFEYIGGGISRSLAVGTRAPGIPTSRSSTSTPPVSSSRSVTSSWCTCQIRFSSGLSMVVFVCPPDDDRSFDDVPRLCIPGRALGPALTKLSVLPLAVRPDLSIPDPVIAELDCKGDGVVRDLTDEVICRAPTPDPLTGGLEPCRCRLFSDSCCSTVIGCVLRGIPGNAGPE